MTIPAGFGQISVIHTGGGIVGEAMWTIGFDNNAIDTPADIATFMETFLTGANYDELISVSCVVTEILVKLGPDDTGPSHLEPYQLPGAFGGNAGPPNVAALVHKNTALGGRQGRGRLFLPCVAELAMGQNGLLDAAYLTDIQTVFDGMLNTFALGNLPLMLLHGDALAPTAITALTADGTFATQRRRLRR